METHESKNSPGRYIKPISSDPCEQAAGESGVGERTVNANNGHPCQKFEVSCRAGDAGHLEVASSAVSVRVGQCIRREGKNEVWGSVLVESKEQDDGSLVVEVLVYHPDWDEPLTVASIRSNPGNGNGAEPALRFEFQQQQHA